MTWAGMFRRADGQKCSAVCYSSGEASGWTRKGLPRKRGVPAEDPARAKCCQRFPEALERRRKGRRVRPNYVGHAFVETRYGESQDEK